jgi:hypothetical protein
VAGLRRRTHKNPLRKPKASITPRLALLESLGYRVATRDEASKAGLKPQARRTAYYVTPSGAVVSRRQAEKRVVGSFESYARTRAEAAGGRAQELSGYRGLLERARKEIAARDGGPLPGVRATQRDPLYREAHRLLNLRSRAKSPSVQRRFAIRKHNARIDALELLGVRGKSSNPFYVPVQRIGVGELFAVRSQATDRLLAGPFSERRAAEFASARIPGSYTSIELDSDESEEDDE